MLEQLDRIPYDLAFVHCQQGMSDAAAANEQVLALCRRAPTAAPGRRHPPARHLHLARRGRPLPGRRRSPVSHLPRPGELAGRLDPPDRDRRAPDRHRRSAARRGDGTRAAEHSCRGHRAGGAAGDLHRGALLPAYRAAAAGSTLPARLRRDEPDYQPRRDRALRRDDRRRPSPVRLGDGSLPRLGRLAGPGARRHLGQERTAIAGGNAARRWAGPLPNPSPDAGEGLPARRRPQSRWPSSERKQRR